MFPNLNSEDACHPRVYLAALNRCEDFVRKHDTPGNADVPDGPFNLLRSELERSLAFVNLSTTCLQVAERYFLRAVESLRLQQGNTWPRGEALYFLYGLAITYHKQRDNERAEDILKSVLPLALTTFEECDPRILEIKNRAKTFAVMANLNLLHHKNALLATTGERRRKQNQNTTISDNDNAKPWTGSTRLRLSTSMRRKRGRTRLGRPIYRRPILPAALAMYIKNSNGSTRPKIYLIARSKSLRAV